MDLIRKRAYSATAVISGKGTWLLINSLCCFVPCNEIQLAYPFGKPAVQIRMGYFVFSPSLHFITSLTKSSGINDVHLYCLSRFDVSKILGTNFTVPFVS